MTDLFSDPILLIPVIAILVIFGAFYVTAMIWSYNRDAKKQGKKSGCLPVIFILVLISGGSIFWTIMTCNTYSIGVMKIIVQCDRRIGGLD